MNFIFLVQNLLLAEKCSLFWVLYPALELFWLGFLVWGNLLDSAEISGKTRGHLTGQLPQVCLSSDRLQSFCKTDSFTNLSIFWQLQSFLRQTAEFPLTRRYSWQSYTSSWSSLRGGGRGFQTDHDLLSSTRSEEPKLLASGWQELAVW